MKDFLSEHAILIMIAIAFVIIMCAIFKYEDSEWRKLQTEVIEQKYRNELLEMKVKEQELKKKLEVEK